MTLPAWVKFGARCVCIDEHFTNVVTLEQVRGPVLDQRYTVTGAHGIGDDGYLILAELSHQPDLWSVDAFRPLTNEERDAEIFDRLLKDASVQKLQEMELML